MRKPTIKTKCVANTYTSQGETIAEVWSPAEKDNGIHVHPARGCLISVREVENAGERGKPAGRGLVIEVYRADPGVFVRINGRDYKLPA